MLKINLDDDDFSSGHYRETSGFMSTFNGKGQLTVDVMNQGKTDFQFNGHGTYKNGCVTVILSDRYIDIYCSAYTFDITGAVGRGGI